MCTGGGGGAGGDGGAAQREAERQAKIDQGYQQIQRIFGGYKSGTGDVSNYTAGQQYYTADGTPVTYATQQVPRQTNGKDLPNAGFDTVGGYNDASGNFTNLGDSKLFSGVTDTPGFDDSFYNARAKSYTDYATPQLDQQYADAVKQLTFALSRNNRLDSSVAGEQRSKLLRDYNTQKTAVADRGIQYGNQARQSVESSRADLVNLNNNTANPNQVAIEAQNRLAGLQAAPAFDPLGPLFANTGDALGTQADLERRSNARYNTGLFTPAAVSSGQGSGRTIR